jgi:hypothetical protein
LTVCVTMTACKAVSDFRLQVMCNRMLQYNDVECVVLRGLFGVKGDNQEILLTTIITMFTFYQLLKD